jgi:hypothetical protein
MNNPSGFSWPNRFKQIIKSGIAKNFGILLKYRQKYKFTAEEQILGLTY